MTPPQNVSSIPEGRTYGILGIVFAVLSLLVLPIVFGPIGVIFGIIGTIKKDVKLGITAIVLSVVLAYISIFIAANIILHPSVQNNAVTPQESTTASAPASSLLPQPTTQTMGENLMTQSTNNSDCKAIAYQAAQTDKTATGFSTIVLTSHFNQSLNQCYYEVNIYGNTGVATDIRVAPDDNWIAEYDSSMNGASQYYTEHNVGFITQQQFQQLETYYLTN